MSLARLADPQIRSSTRGRTDCTLLPATPVVLDEVSLLSRPVSLPKLVRDGDSRVKWWSSHWVGNIASSLWRSRVGDWRVASRSFHSGQDCQRTERRMNNIENYVGK